MAKVDYYGIVNEVGNILNADAELLGVQVTIEDEPPLDSGPWVAVYLESRTPTVGQSMSAGTRTRFQLRMTVWCWQFSIESTARAAQLRDELVGKVEIALMKNRTLNDKVGSIWLDGGQLLSEQIKSDSISGFIAGGEIVVLAEVVAIT